VRADDYQCTGTLGAIQVGTLVVPQNASCTLNGTIVNGNLYVYTNAALDAYDVWVNNNLQADGAVHVNVYAGSSVGGNLEVVRSGAADIQAVDIKNNLYFNENHQFLNVSSNTIGGNLQATKNTGGVAINGNHIGGNLQCRENVPPPSGVGNIVRGNMEDQCANFGGVPTPSPTNTPPAATQTPGVDLEAPTVQWIAPVVAEQRFDVREGEQVLLRVEASDNSSIQQVRFLWWDAVNVHYVTLGTIYQAPFQIEINASTLNPGWNEIFVNATDVAGNRSDFPFIWLYKLVQEQMNNQIFLPFTGK